MVEENFEYPIQTIFHQVKTYKVGINEYMFEIRGKIVNLDFYMSEKRYNNLSDELPGIIDSYLYSEFEKSDKGKVRVFTNEKIELDGIKKEYNENDFYQLKNKYGVSYGNLMYNKSRIKILGISYIDKSDRILYENELKKLYL